MPIESFSTRRAKRKAYAEGYGAGFSWTLWFHFWDALSE